MLETNRRCVVVERPIHTQAIRVRAPSILKKILCKNFFFAKIFFFLCQIFFFFFLMQDIINLIRILLFTPKVINLILFFLNLNLGLFILAGFMAI